MLFFRIKLNFTIIIIAIGLIGCGGHKEKFDVVLSESEYIEDTRTVLEPIWLSELPGVIVPLDSYMVFRSGADYYSISLSESSGYVIIYTSVLKFVDGRIRVENSSESRVSFRKLASIDSHEIRINRLLIARLGSINILYPNRELKSVWLKSSPTQLSARILEEIFEGQGQPR